MKKRVVKALGIWPSKATRIPIPKVAQKARAHSNMRRAFPLRSKFTGDTVPRVFFPLLLETLYVT